MSGPAVPSLVDHLDLEVTGMTCAACANRIERRLNKIDGVQASVTYATETARVEFDPALVVPTDLVPHGERPDWDALFARHGELVIKPAVSAGSAGRITSRFGIARNAATVSTGWCGGPSSPTPTES